MATEIKSTSIKSQNIIAEPQVNKPGSPEAGQIIQSTGTGDIAKGIYHYSGASWFSLDNAQGDLETLRLVLSTDTTAVGFSSALNSTSTLAGNTNAVPHETSTGTGMLGALEIPSTGGDALLTEFDANKVFRYYSAGANNNNDYFGIPIDIPAQTRGQNIVIKFKYRTEEAATSSSNGDFQVSVWDKSNGVKTTSTNTSTVAANAAITVADSTGMAVGDKIWLESGGNAVNNVGNSITQAYITEVTSGTAIEISEDWTPASTAGSVVVSGWLSDQVSGLLSEADSDTNKVGKDFSIAVKTEETTDQIVLWISNKSTTTNVIELFFDGILVSQNKFLQASSQTKNESYFAKEQNNFWAGSGSGQKEWAISSLVPEGGSPLLAQSKLLDIAVSGSQTNITARQNCTVIWNIGAPMTADGYISIKNQDDDVFGYEQNSGTANKNVMITVSVNLNKGEYLYADCISPHSVYGYTSITAMPQTSDVILLESQDEIFTDWQDGGAMTYSQTSTTGSKPSSIQEDQVYWRRDGSDMILKWTFYASSGTGATAGSGDYLFHLPSGYAMDSSKVKYYTSDEGYGDFTTQSSTMLGYGQLQDNDGGAHFRVNLYAYDSNKFRAAGLVTTHATVTRHAYVGSGNGYDFVNMNVMTFEARIPIQGWNTNFNPLLSLPLVDTGAENGEIRLNGWSGAASYSVYADAANIVTNTLSGLATLSNSSTEGFYITAQQDIIATANFTQRSNDTGSYNIIVSGPASIWDRTKSSGDANWDGYRISMDEDASGYVHNASASVRVPAGHILGFITSNTNSPFTGKDVGATVIQCRKDHSHTNMAHIIKPAVAVLTDEKSGTTNGGSSVSTGWTARELNVVRGETWFVSGSFDGLGGTNTNFTLEPGTYEIEAFAPFYNTAYTQLRLYDVTNSDIAIVGTNCQTVSNNGFINGPVYGVLTLTSSTEYALQYRTSTAQATYGLGEDSTFSAAGDKSVFSNVKIRKLK